MLGMQIGGNGKWIFKTDKRMGRKGGGKREKTPSLAFGAIECRLESSLVQTTRPQEDGIQLYFPIFLPNYGDVNA